MPHYLLEKRLSIAGHEIYCKVTGAPGSANNGQPYFLMIQGGPGFSHESIFAKHETYANIFKGDPVHQPHFIYYDPPGMGASSTPQTDEEKEKTYTVAHFTEVAAQLIEAIQKELCIDQVDLRVYGRSFGSVPAMMLPTARKQWTQPQSPVRVNQIMTSSGVGVEPNEMAALAFIEAHFRHYPNQEGIRNSIRKLFRGEIKSKADYIKHIALTLAPLYSDKMMHLANSFLGSILMTFPMACLYILKCIHFLFRFHFIKTIIDGLDGCNYEPLNYFFISKMDHLNVPKVIKENESLYRNINICLITSDLDYIATDTDHAMPIAEALDSIGIIDLHAKHMYHADLPEIGFVLDRFLMKDGAIDEAYLVSKGDNVVATRIPEVFKSQLAKLKYIPQQTTLSDKPSLFSSDELPTNGDSPMQSPSARASASRLA